MSSQRRRPNAYATIHASFRSLFSLVLALKVIGSKVEAAEFTIECGVTQANNTDLVVNIGNDGQWLRVLYAILTEPCRQSVELKPFRRIRRHQYSCRRSLHSHLLRSSQNNISHVVVDCMDHYSKGARHARWRARVWNLATSHAISGRCWPTHHQSCCHSQRFCRASLWSGNTILRRLDNVMLKRWNRSICTLDGWRWLTSVVWVLHSTPFGNTHCLASASSSSYVTSALHIRFVKHTVQSHRMTVACWTDAVSAVLRRVSIIALASRCWAAARLLHLEQPRLLMKIMPFKTFDWHANLSTLYFLTLSQKMGQVLNYSLLIICLCGFNNFTLELMLEYVYMRFFQLHKVQFELLNH